MSKDNTPEDSFGEKLFLALIVSILFFFGSYITSTIISEALGRRGLPGSPLLYAIITYPLSLLVVFYEHRVKNSRYSAYFDPYWFIAVGVIGSGVPIVLTIFTPLLFWQSLPRGGAVGVVIVVEITVLTAGLLRGLYAGRRNNV